MIGVLPLGRMPGIQKQKAAIFWSLPASAYPEWKKEGIDAWKEASTNLWAAFQPFVEQITDSSQMTMASYTHGSLLKPYSERLVHIGDAAHRASPQLGQGANMALLDALALSRAIAAHPLTEALPKYAKARRWHVGTYQLMSRLFTPMYQSDSRLLPMIRDRILYPVSQIPPTPRLLTSLVCGTMLPAVRKI